MPDQLPIPVEPQPPVPENWVERVAKLIEGFIANIPGSNELASDDPDVRAKQIIQAAALKAGATSGGLAIPSGPIAWFTMIPDLLLIWKIQGQMVADIAASYGKTASLGQKEMLYCLFRHAASQAVRDVVLRVGDRYLLRQKTLTTVQHMVRAIAPHITQKAIKGGLGRIIPILGAAGVGAYAFFDTKNVGKTAVELFSNVEQEDSVLTLEGSVE